MWGSVKCSNCVECKKKNKSSIKTNEIIFIADSGASATFMYDINDFSKYEKLPVPSEAHTANEGKPLKIVGKGTVFMRHEVCTGLWVNIWMYPVFHIPDLSGWLMSISKWLKNGYTLKATEEIMSIRKKTGEDALSLFSQLPGDIIFWFCCTLIKESAQIISMSTIHSVDYNLIHHHMGHPSHNVLKQVSKNTWGFPSDILIPMDLLICQGCARGKMYLNVLIGLETEYAWIIHFSFNIILKNWIKKIK